jgi:DNA-binding NarL/FixJ family response regulator
VTPLRVVVADDHPLFRDGLRALMIDCPETDLVGTAASGDEAVALVSEHRPDVVVMDLRMPGMNGIDATRIIARHQPGVAVLVLTMVEDDSSVFAAMRAGARGYVLKGAEPAEIIRSIVAVAGGQAIFGAQVAARIMQLFASPPDAAGMAFPTLTNRERDILRRLSAGHSNPRIAAALDVTEKTVRNNVTSIFAKLHVTDRAAAVARARDAGIDPTT